MANTLTAIINDVYAELTEAPKQVRGALDAIRMDLDSTPVDIGQPLITPLIGAKSSGSWTPVMYVTSVGDQTAGSVSLSLSGVSTPFNCTDAERKNMIRSGTFTSFMKQNILEACAANSVTVGAALITALKQGAARASGTAGTTPFASDTAELEDAGWHLNYNGAPSTDRACVLSSAAWRKFRKLGIVQQANLNGGDARKTGLLGNESGFEMFCDYGITAHTKGTATGEQVHDTLAVGDEDVTMDGSDSGTVLAGDIMTVAADTGDPDGGSWKYVVSGITANTLTAAASGIVYFGRPGIRVAYAEDAEITIGANYTPSFAFSRSAIKAVVRPVACDVGGQTVGAAVIQDQYGMPATLIEVRGTGMVTYMVAQAYGFKVVKPYGVHTILG